MQLLKPSQLDGAERADSGVPRDRYDRPLIGVPGRDGLVPYTRCTTFVDCIADKSALSAWGKRMVLVGVARHPDLAEHARGLDPSDQRDKKILDRLAENAAVAAGAHAKRDAGTHLHTLSEFVDRGDPLPPCRPADVADMAAYKAATVFLDVLHVERLIVVDRLRVAGTPDRISHYDGPGPDGTRLNGNLITDLKTGSIDYSSLTMAMQLAVYSRGEFYDHRDQTRTPLPDVNQRWGLIIHLPVGSAQCTLHWVDLNLGWRAVQVARDVRALRATRHVMRPFETDPDAAVASRVASPATIV